MMKKAFTLAEVLITLAVIGVLAALTVPLLVQNYQDSKLRTLWRKDYSVISQSYKHFVSDNGGDITDVFATEDDFVNAFFDKFITKKKCLAATPTGANGCIEYSYTTWDKNTAPHFAATSSGAILQDGTLLALANGFDTKCATPNGSLGKYCATLYIDINGFTAPNKVGVDIFVVALNSDGRAIALGSPGDAWYGQSIYDCPSNPVSTWGWNCSAKYLYVDDLTK